MVAVGTKRPKAENGAWKPYAIPGWFRPPRTAAQCAPGSSEDCRWPLASHGLSFPFHEPRMLHDNNDM